MMPSMITENQQFDSGWPLFGHTKAVQMLSRSLRSGHVSHAYLITGPPGVGKRTLAIAFAMALNCEAADPPLGTFPIEPCGLCRSCGQILRGAHPDVAEIDLQVQAAALNDGRSKQASPKEIRIDLVRELQASIGLQPYSGRRRVYIIGDADRLNEEASNCLLKTLEEPPAQAVLLLLAPDELSVLPTISSRCLHIPLRPLPLKAVEVALVERWNAPEDEAGLLAALSGGRPGRALALLRDRDAPDRRKLALERVALLSGSSISERISLAADLAKLFTDTRVELYEMLDTWESWWRDVAVVGASASELITNRDQSQALVSSAKRVGVQQAAKALELIDETRLQLQENVNPRLAFEALTIGLP